MTDNYDSTPNLDLKKPEHGSYEGYWEIPVNENSDKVDAAFDPASGHNHDGSSLGSGSKVDHNNLLSIGTNSHDDIDAHIADTALHLDGVKVGTVTGIDPAITVTDVSEIEFENAVVTDMGGGVVRVVTASSSGPGYTAPFYAKPESSAIAYTDNFNWAPGSVLADHSWCTILSYPSMHDWVVGGAVVGSYAYIRTEVTNGLFAQDGFAIAHCTGHIPHGTAQRVTVKVDSFRPYKDVDGLIADNDGLTYVAGNGLDDAVTLSLDLMSATQGFVAGRPCLYGISLLIRKVPGTATLSYTLNVRSDSTPPVSGTTMGALWTDFSNGPNGDLQGAPYSDIEGWHELALRRHPTITGAYSIHYYHNEGLSWYKTFNPASTDVNEARIAAEIGALTQTLATSTNPSEPPYGRIGFSLGFTLDNQTSHHVYELRVRHASIGSQDDEQAVKAVDIPESTVPVVSVPVCSSGPFTGFDTGEPFPYQGQSTNPGQFWISAKFTDLGINQNQSGFLVSGGLVSDLVYCASPSPGSPPVNNQSVFYSDTFMPGGETGRGVFLDGGRLVRGDKAGAADNLLVTVTAVNSNEIPRDWNTAGAFTAGYYTAGEELPTSFIDVFTIDARWVDPASQAERILCGYVSGPRIPIGAEVSVTVTPKYELSFDATWQPLLIAQPVPSIESHTTLVWDSVGFYSDTNTGVNSRWVDVTPDGNGDPYVLEGSTVCFGASIDKLPLGLDFWQGDGFLVPTDFAGTIKHVVVESSDLVGTYSVAITPNSTSTSIFRNVSRPFFITDEARITKYFDAVLPYELGVGTDMLIATAVGVPPPTAVNTDKVLEHANVQFNTISQNTESVAQIHKLSDSIANLVVRSVSIPNMLSLNMADTVYPSGNSLTFLPTSAQKSIPILSSLQILPRNPEVIAHEISDLAAGASVTMQFIVRYHHDIDITGDLTATAVDGLTSLTVSSAPVYYGGIDSTQTDPTLVTPSGYNAYRRLICTGVLDTSGPVVVRVKKTATYNWINTQPQAVQDFLDSKGIDGTTLSVGDITLGIIDEVAHPTVVNRGTPLIKEGEISTLRFYVGGVDLSTKTQDEIISNIQLVVPAYLDLVNLRPVIYKDDDTGAPAFHYGIYVVVNCGDAGGDTTADLEFLSAGVPGPGTIKTISIDPAVAPTIVGGGLNSALTQHIWTVDGQLLPSDVYFTLQDVKLGATISIALVSTNPSASIDYDPIVPVPSAGSHTYQVQIRLISDQPYTGDYLMLYTSNTYINNLVKTSALGNGVATDFVEFEEEQVVGPTSYTVDSIVFSLPRQAQYTPFKLPGVFDFTGIDPTDMTEVNARFSIDVVREDDLTTMLWDFNIAALGSEITDASDGITSDTLYGWVVVTNNNTNVLSAIKVTNNDTSEVTYYRPNMSSEEVVSSFYFEQATVPIINLQAPIQIIEGTSGMHSITGTGLMAPAAPAGETELPFAYAYEYSGLTDPVNTYIASPKDTGRVDITIGVDAASAGQIISLVINDALGGTRAQLPIFEIIAAPAGTLSIDDVVIYPYTAAHQYANDETITASTIPYTTNSAEDIRIVVRGDYLAYNIKSAYITVCGDDSVDGQMPPAYGWSVADIASRNVQLTVDVPIFTPNGIGETIVYVAPKTIRWSSQRVKIFFEDVNNPGTYFDPSTIDNTGVGTVGTLADAGMTVKYGPAFTETLKVNTDPGAGPTPYDSARSAQNSVSGWSIPPDEQTFTVPLLLTEVPASNPTTSSFTMDADGNGAMVRCTGVAPDGGGGLAWNVSFTTVDGLDGVKWQAGAHFGVKFRSGQPWFAVRVGEADWGNDADDVAF
jgi:hypothetical protein